MKFINTLYGDRTRIRRQRQQALKAALRAKRELVAERAARASLYPSQRLWRTPRGK